VECELRKKETAMSIIESAAHTCPGCDAVMYFAEGRYRCGGKCGFTIKSADTQLWKAVWNLQRMLHAVEGMLRLLPTLEKKHEGPPTDFCTEALRDTAFMWRAGSGSLDKS
jgi:ribosomal protein S27AE